jgi:hypothetical protein
VLKFTYFWVNNLGGKTWLENGQFLLVVQIFIRWSYNSTHIENVCILLTNLQKCLKKILFLLPGKGSFTLTRKKYFSQHFWRLVQKYGQILWALCLKGCNILCVKHSNCSYVWLTPLIHWSCNFTWMSSTHIETVHILLTNLQKCLKNSFFCFQETLKKVYF